MTSTSEFTKRQRARSKHTHRYWKRHDRDDFECPQCGRHADDVDQIDVHHRDEDPLNGDPDNLVALCHRCHLAEHDQEPEPTLDDWKDGFLSLGDGHKPIDDCSRLHDPSDDYWRDTQTTLSGWFA